jgi:hypothetical protein
MQSPSDQSIQIKRQQRQQKVALNLKYDAMKNFMNVGTRHFFDFMNPQKRLSEARFSGE